VTELTARAASSNLFLPRAGGPSASPLAGEIAARARTLLEADSRSARTTRSNIGMLIDAHNCRSGLDALRAGRPRRSPETGISRLARLGRMAYAVLRAVGRAKARARGEGSSPSGGDVFLAPSGSGFEPVPGAHRRATARWQTSGLRTLAHVARGGARSGLLVEQVPRRRRPSGSARRPRPARLRPQQIRSGSPPGGVCSSSGPARPGARAGRLPRPRVVSGRTTANLVGPPSESTGRQARTTTPEGAARPAVAARSPSRCP